MALGTDHLSAASLAEVIPEIWSGQANKFYRSRLLAAKFFLDLSDEVRNGGDIINIGNYTEPSANTKTFEAQVTYQDTDMTGGQLSVTTWKEASHLIEDNEASQVMNSARVQETLVSGLSYAVAKAYDAAILGLYSGLSQTVNDSASQVEDADILAAISLLDAVDVPQEDRAFFFRPTVGGDLMAISKYYDASVTGQAQSPIMNGSIRTLYGIPVYLTNNVVVTSSTYAHNLLAHKSAFVHAHRNLEGQKDENGIRFQANYVPQYLGTSLTADVIYGVAENRDAAAVHIASAT